MEKAFLATKGLLVVRDGGSYDGKGDAFVDISVYDARDPIAEIFRLYRLQKIHFEKSDPKDVVPIQGEDARFLQKMLARKGFLKNGRTDGIWDDASTKALRSEERRVGKEWRHRSSM